jgi:hypothetical protein
LSPEGQKCNGLQALGDDIRNNNAAHSQVMSINKSTGLIN